MTLFDHQHVVGAFLGFSQGGLEFHADIVLPYQNEFQRSPMHGQFVLVALEHDSEAVLGRITNITAQGRLASSSGEDYAIRAVREDREIPEDLRSQYLKYRIDIRILGVLREQGGDKPPVFVASHRRLPHVGAKVAFLSPLLLRRIAGHEIDGDGAAELGFFALGEFVFAEGDQRAGDTDWLQVRGPLVIPKFRVEQLVSRRSFVFARAGFGKSNLVKLLFAKLYGGGEGPTVEKRNGRKVPVGTVIFDPDGEYFWPDDKGRPGLCDVPALRDRMVVFTDRKGPSDFYDSFVVDKVRLDIRELPPARVIGLVIPADRQDQQNVAKLRGLKPDTWRALVDVVYKDLGGTDLNEFYAALQLKKDGSQDAEALAARSNMVRVVQALHDPSSQLLRALVVALEKGYLAVVDISRMRGAQGLALAGIVLQHLFEHNQDEFTNAVPRTIPTIAVIEEAQSVLGRSVSHSEGPFVEWVKEGRKYDLGAVLVTQQPGSLPHELLSQGDNWFVFHLLSAGDLRALQAANAHFSDDLLSSLLNEPLVGHGIFWSSAGGTPYPIPFRALSFQGSYEMVDPNYDRNREPIAAVRLRKAFEDAVTAAGEAIAKAGGEVPTSGDRGDVLEALQRAAIAQLEGNQDFQRAVRTEKGYLWWKAQQILAEVIPKEVAGDDPFQWVYDQGLVVRAFNEILGERCWRTEARPKTTDPSKSERWVIAEATANPPRSRPAARPVRALGDADEQTLL